MSFVVRGPVSVTRLQGGLPYCISQVMQFYGSVVGLFHPGRKKTGARRLPSMDRLETESAVLTLNLTKALVFVTDIASRIRGTRSIE